jgi:Asp-tRNA(Asn)/Glu-tRNA(Gln) amidotransferase A subunit family amidase
MYGAADCALAARLKAAGAVLMAKTNVPEFAASWITLNRTNGVVWNPYPCTDGALTTGGSSGGAAFAVAGRIAPIAMTEDTGGSTRHPASQCGNFGYDPPRNKYPNDGNPGITYYNDQVGINARSFEDVLLYDAAVTGAAAEHAAAAARVAALPTSAIKIGFPREIFVELNLPTDPGKGRRASDEIISKLEACRRVLGAAGFSSTREDWPAVDSGRFGKVHALYQLIFGEEYAPGKYTEGNMIALGSHSFTGQMATFCADWLKDCDVSVNQIRADVTPVGQHNPAGLMGSFTDESQFRALGRLQQRGAAALAMGRIVIQAPLSIFYMDNH